MYQKIAPGVWLDTQTREVIQAKRRRGRYGKAVVAVCILLAVAYTGVCLAMQWITGQQPEPQFTIAFMGFIASELWNLSKIKRTSKREGGDQDG